MVLAAAAAAAAALLPPQAAAPGVPDVLVDSRETPLPMSCCLPSTTAARADAAPVRMLKEGMRKPQELLVAAGAAGMTEGVGERKPGESVLETGL